MKTTRHIILLIKKSLWVMLPVIAGILILHFLKLSSKQTFIAYKILLIVAIAWIAAQWVRMGQRKVLSKYNLSTTSDLRTRKIHTQVHIIGKTLYFLIGLLAAGSILMLFDTVHAFGRNLLASAGVTGIIIGIAAQRIIANFFAGFQLAITQPIRLNDRVIVEGEFGQVEEITMTYVIIRTWDERRIVVPLSYFIEKHFQNWTYASSTNILGVVFLWVDYSTPIAELRLEAERIITSNPLWDGRVWRLHVADTTDRAVQIRILASVSDPANSWELRCDIREKMIAFLQENYPKSLPRERVDIQDKN